MVKVKTQAQRFAKRAPEGKGKTKVTFFGGRSGSRARSARQALASGEPTGSTYLRDGLLVLCGVAAGILLGRQSKRGGAQEATSIVDLPPPPEVTKADLPPPPEVTRADLPPPPIPEEQNVGYVPPPPDTEPSVETADEDSRTEGPS